MCTTHIRYAKWEAQGGALVSRGAVHEAPLNGAAVPGRGSAHGREVGLAHVEVGVVRLAPVV